MAQCAADIAKFSQDKAKQEQQYQELQVKLERLQQPQETGSVVTKKLAAQPARASSQTKGVKLCRVLTIF